MEMASSIERKRSAKVMGGRDRAPSISKTEHLRVKGRWLWEPVDVEALDVGVSCGIRWSWESTGVEVLGAGVPGGTGG